MEVHIEKKRMTEDQNVENITFNRHQPGQDDVVST